MSQKQWQLWNLFEWPEHPLKTIREFEGASRERLRGVNNLTHYINNLESLLYENIIWCFMWINYMFSPRNIMSYLLALLLHQLVLLLLPCFTISHSQSYNSHCMFQHIIPAAFAAEVSVSSRRVCDYKSTWDVCISLFSPVNNKRATKVNSLICHEKENWILFSLFIGCVSGRQTALHFILLMHIRVTCFQSQCEFGVAVLCLGSTINNLGGGVVQIKKNVWRAGSEKIKSRSTASAWLSAHALLITEQGA